MININKLTHKTLFWLLLSVTALGCTRVVDSVESDQSDWTKHESSHFNFYVRPGSEADASIDEIMQEQEWAYRKVEDTLGYESNQKLLVYLYKSKQDLGETQYTGKAYPEVNTIEAIYSSELKSIGRRGVSLHELTHIASYYSWCPSHTPFFSEGLAVWMDDYWSAEEIGSTDLYQIAKVRLRREQLPSAGELTRNWGDFESDRSYPTAGAFVKYLIDRHGLSSFRDFYCRAKERNFEDIFFDIYDQRIEKFENQFHDFLRNY